ncbi:MAG: phospholipid carrier-dependent glycosyltransferase [Planctomycetes bacterium]|nr:phospholipid carrier-dependent glycosyltransferase [Planctomycetota bacterium]
MADPLPASGRARAARSAGGVRPATWLGLALLLGLHAAVLLGSLGAPPVHREAELRVQRVTGNMLASGDWLVPRLEAGEPRLQKPPLYYWLAAGSAALLGDGSFALRLPAAAASLVLVLLAFAWGRARGGARTGLLAAALVACMPGVTQFGRLGVAETLLAATSVGALAAFDADRAAGRAAGWLGVACFALALLAKATAALLVVGLPIALVLASEGRARLLLTRRALALALLALLPALAWYVAVLVRVPGAREALASFALLPFGVRLPEAAGNAAHLRPFWSHGVHLVTLIAPLAAFLPLLLRRAWRTRGWRDQPGLRLAALACAGPFVAFSLIPQKQDHYLLPLLVPLALLLADTLEDACRPEQGRGWRATAAIVASLVAGGGLLLVEVAREAFAARPAACLTLALGCAILGAFLVRQAWFSRLLPFAGGLAAGTLACMLYWYGVVDVERQRLDAGVVGAEELSHWRDVTREHPALGGLFRVEAAGGDGER